MPPEIPHHAFNKASGQSPWQCACNTNLYHIRHQGASCTNQKDSQPPEEVWREHQTPDSLSIELGFFLRQPSRQCTRGKKKNVLGGILGNSSSSFLFLLSMSSQGDFHSFPVNFKLDEISPDPLKIPSPSFPLTTPKCGISHHIPSCQMPWNQFWKLTICTHHGQLFRFA